MLLKGIESRRCREARQRSNSGILLQTTDVRGSVAILKMSYCEHEYYIAELEGKRQFRGIMEGDSPSE